MVCIPPGLDAKSMTYRRIGGTNGFLRVVLASLALALAIDGKAQAIKPVDDGTVLKDIIIFGRHSIRSPIYAPSVLNQYSADPYPAFAGTPGYLTTNGQRAAYLLGCYFHDYLTHEGLLTGNPDTDLARCYFRANTIQRSYMTCAQFGAGMVPGANIPVRTYEAGTPDPVIDPLLAGVATVDANLALAQVQGIYGSGSSLQAALSGELSLVSKVLYPPGTQPLYPPGTPPPTNAPQGAVDPTTLPITFMASTPLPQSPVPYCAGEVVNMGGLGTVALYATDPFVMQYADGFPLDQVGWGRLTLDTLSEQTRIATLQIAASMRTPYLARVQSSNAGHHILRSLQRVVEGGTGDGGFGDPQSQIQVIVSSDFYVAGLAGLLDLHWLLPGYQPDFCAPSGALVFELRQVKATGQHLVRVFYTTQTLDQLRNLKPLTLTDPPATMQLTVPGGSNSFTNLDVDFGTFAALLTNAIDLKCVQAATNEIPPTVLNPYTATNATSISASARGSTISLTWPTEHQGWILQAQTNGLENSLWFDVPGTAQVNSTPLAMDPAQPAVFYRLRRP
jgi:4-phytase/acid phosphatase